METLQGIWAGLLSAAALAPLATFAVVLVAYLGYRQKSRSDMRDQWWKRAQWAIDSALSDADPQRRLAGLKVLVQLIGSDLATAEDADLMCALALAIRDQEQDGKRQAALSPPATPSAVSEKILAEVDRLLGEAASR